jgi:hypothetical protein
VACRLLTLSEVVMSASEWTPEMIGKLMGELRQMHRQNGLVGDEQGRFLAQFESGVASYAEMVNSLRVLVTITSEVPEAGVCGFVATQNRIIEIVAMPAVARVQIEGVGELC